MSLIKNEYTLTVDLKKPTTNIRPRFVQYDNAILYFKVYDNGKDFNFSEQTEIQVAHRKKSGRTEVGRASVITGNDGKPLIKYEYMGSEMDEVGNVTTSVSILSGTKKVTIQPFVVEMLKDIHSGVVDKVNKEYSLLQQLITTVESAVKSAVDSANLVKDAVSNAEIALESATTLRESWKYLDVYDLTKSYKKNNVVSYNGSSYIAIADNVGKTPVGDIKDAFWRLVAKKGTDGNGTVVLYSDTFQGKKGQTVFNLTHEYDQMQNRIHLVVGGIIQHSPLDFMETSSTKVTLNYPLEDDMRVVAVYFGQAPVITNDLQVQIDSIKEIVQVFNLVEVMNAGKYATTQGDYAKQQGDIAKTNASEALLAKQATETATTNANATISEMNQLKTTVNSTLNTATSNANSATQRANDSATLANQSANNAQAVADNTVSVGTFVLSKAYKKNNLVLNNGTTWMALKDTIFNPLPILPTTENEFWRLVAQRGVDGSGSVSSVNGVQPDMTGNVLIGVSEVNGLQESLDELQTFIKKESFVSTAGQTVFTLTQGTYLINENRVEVEVGGVPQFSPINFTETNETTITINEPLQAGLTVVITYYSDFHPIRTDVEGRLLAVEDGLNTVKADSLDAINQVAEMQTSVEQTQGHLLVHLNSENNPHKVTKEQVGLGNVDNTSDMDKPVSTAQREAIDTVHDDLLNQVQDFDSELQSHKDDAVSHVSIADRIDWDSRARTQDIEALYQYVDDQVYYQGLDIGDLTSLNTTDKSTLVNAINEVASREIDSSPFTTKYGIDTSTNNAKAVTIAGVTEYIDGMAVAFKVNSTWVSGNASLDVNGLGAKWIRKSNDTSLPSNSLKANSIYTVRFNATNQSFILQGEGGEYGTATASQVLSGRTFGTENGLVTGTMPDKSGFFISGGIVANAGETQFHFIPPKGYYDGTASTRLLVDDDKFRAANIRKGINMFGLLGTLAGQKYASGTAQSTTGSGGEYIYINNLGFRPRCVVAKLNGRSDLNRFAAVFLYSPQHFGDLDFRMADDGQVYANSGTQYFSDNSFRMQVDSLNSRTYNWVAFGSDDFN